MDKEKLVVKIEQAAEMIGTCQRTLRIWDNLGLLSPDRRGKGLGQRVYSETDVELGKKVSQLLSMGVGTVGAVIIISEMRESGFSKQKISAKLEKLIEKYKVEKPEQKKRGRKKNVRK